MTYSGSGVPLCILSSLSTALSKIQGSCTNKPGVRIRPPPIPVWGHSRNPTDLASHTSTDTCQLGAWVTSLIAVNDNSMIKAMRRRREVRFVVLLELHGTNSQIFCLRKLKPGCNALSETLLLRCLPEKLALKIDFCKGGRSGTAASHVEINLYSLNKCLLGIVLGTGTVKIVKVKAFQSPKIPVLTICCRQRCNMSFVPGHPTQYSPYGQRQK